MIYSINQWLLFFYIYCLAGWIWESSYVSIKEFIKKKEFKFINRGFLHGPWVPIYGSAAIIILISTLKVNNNIILIFIFGSIAATALEFVTGNVMEKLFHAKYWDYSDYPLNYKGYISLISSLFWGLLSIFLVSFLHTKISNISSYINIFYIDLLVNILNIVFIIDIVKSTDEAIGLKKLMEEITENNEYIRKIERRIDARIAFSHINNINIDGSKILYSINEIIDDIEEKYNILKEKVEENEIKTKIEDNLKNIRILRDKHYLNGLNQIKRNNLVVQEKYKDIIEKLKNII